MVIRDSQTGQQLFESVLPEDFTVRAAKNVLNYPDNSRVCFELAAERNGCRITYQTGGSYVYEKKRFQSPFGFSPAPQTGTQALNGAWYCGGVPSLQEELDGAAASVAGKQLEAVSVFALPDSIRSEVLEEFRDIVDAFVSNVQILASFQTVPVGNDIRNYLFDGAMAVYGTENDVTAVCLARTGMEVDVVQRQGVTENITGEPFGQAGDSPWIVTSSCEWTVPFLFTLRSDRKEDLRAFMEFIENFRKVPELKAELKQFRQQVDQYQLQRAQMEAMQNRQMWNIAFARQQQQFAAMDRLTQSIHQDLDQFHSGLFAQIQQNDARIRTGSQSMAEESMDDRIQRGRHESIMGVDTYGRNDGTTVEYSNEADRVFESNLDSTAHFGTRNYYDDFVPEGWHELKKF